MPDLGDELYGLPPAEFVAARTALVARLKADGERELAAAVKARRRPTAAGGELNRLLRLVPQAVEELIAAADRLRAANQRLLEGANLDLEPLRLEHRTHAADVAGQAQRDEHKLRTALETASLDPAMHQDLRSAVFVDLPTPTQGFDLLTPTSNTTQPPTAPSHPQADRPETTTQSAPESPPAVAPPKGRSAGPSKRRQERETARDRADHDRAARRRAAAQQRAEKARQRVAELEARLQAAYAHLEQCEAQVEAAAVAQARAEGGDPTTPA